MKPELLSPAGDFISLRAAIKAGADAIYFGIKMLNMRANAKNFTLTDMKKIVELCHDNNVKAYLTLNTIVYESELGKLERIIKKAKEAKVDAIIGWDFSVLKIAKASKMRIHLSTQASVSNFLAARYYHEKFDVKRIVLARECSLCDIRSIIKRIRAEKLDLEIETFIHGAMCVSVSGRCFLSQFQLGRSANKGDCIQPCRRSYLIRDKEEKHEFDLNNDFILSPKDLCTLSFLYKLMKAGISSFKIEGRNRSPEYVKVVTECYREYIDNYPDVDVKKLMARLESVYNRGFSKGFFMGRPIGEWTNSYGSKAVKKKKYVGRVINYYSKVGAAEIILLAGSIKLGDIIMIQGDTTGVYEQKIISMQMNNKKIQIGKKGESIGIKISEKVRKNDKVFIFV